MNIVINIFGEGKPSHAPGFEQRVEASLVELHRKADSIMATGEGLKAAQAQLIADFDAETTAVAARLDKIAVDNAAAIKALQDQIAAGTAATPEQLQALSDGFTALGAISSRLKVLGADAGNPIPPNPLPAEPPVENPPVPGTVG